MSFASLYQSSVDRLHREIERVERELSRVSQDEARKGEQISRLHSSVNAHTSLSVRQQKARELERLQRELTRLVRQRADLTKELATKNSNLRRDEQRLRQEQMRDQERDERARAQREVQLQATLTAQRRQIETLTRSEAAPAHSVEDAEYDLFISHASEDKAEIATPLAEALQLRGLSVWYDDFVLSVGDSLRRKIDYGLARSRYGVVVLSPAFFEKEWPQRELDGLVAKETAQQAKAILPIWHKVSKNEVLSFSPTLADKVALTSTTYTIDELADKIAEVVMRPAETADEPGETREASGSVTVRIRS